MFSLDDICRSTHLQKTHGLINMVSYALQSYDNFTEFVRFKLDYAVSELESTANKIGFEQTEDALTLYLLALVKEPLVGFDAYHEVNQRGHCDITLKLGDFVWHGEAKKHSSGYAYLFKGYAQLTERYSTGSVTSCSGGLIIYNNNQLCSDVMMKWKNFLQKNAVRIHASKISPLLSGCNKNPLVFYSVHKHTLTNLDYRVIHYPINFYHDPKDRKL
ncbi:hypothetical protein MXL79_10825 [Serratia ureilytica]|uniref:hypothetical protein n=1 Tax=Serratia ureilytica TaxID=300181 RepID=UPI002DBDF833|nr:hypothetical protein [Serratia ureilytica]MEB5993649.1 hypothetical protein [Serratia ureilytica]